MTPIEAIHTAARRYCIDRHQSWCERYAEIGRKGKDRKGGSYTPEALSTFPRYNVLAALRLGIERLLPSDFDSLAMAREALIAAGKTSNSIFTLNPIGAIDRKAMADERKKFCSFVRDLSEREMADVAPLPFRHVLGADEAGRLRERLRARWKIAESYWFPLSPCSLDKIEAFQDRGFRDALPPSSLRRILREQGIRRIWEFRESGPEYEEDLECFDPFYNGDEGFWSAGTMDWIVYVSHESSITIGGWLLEKVKRSWPGWKKKVWTSPFF